MDEPENQAPETDTVPATALATRIEAARARSTDMAAKARDFVQDHPVATVAGGLAAGALIAGLLASRRRKAPRLDAEAATESSAGLARLAALAAELALTYAARATTAGVNAGKDGVHKLEEIGETVSETGAQAGRKLGGLAELALAALREAQGSVRERIGELTRRKHD